MWLEDKTDFRKKCQGSLKHNSSYNSESISMQAIALNFLKILICRSQTGFLNLWQSDCMQSASLFFLAHTFFCHCVAFCDQKLL
jgi:hypothetical protein